MKKGEEGSQGTRSEEIGERERKDKKMRRKSISLNCSFNIWQ